MQQKLTKTILCMAIIFFAHTATAQVTDFKYRTSGFKAVNIGYGFLNRFYRDLAWHKIGPPPVSYASVRGTRNKRQ